MGPTVLDTSILLYPQITANELREPSQTPGFVLFYFSSTNSTYHLHPLSSPVFLTGSKNGETRSPLIASSRFLYVLGFAPLVRSCDGVVWIRCCAPEHSLQLQPRFAIRQIPSWNPQRRRVFLLLLFFFFLSFSCRTCRMWLLQMDVKRNY